MNNVVGNNEDGRYGGGLGVRKKLFSRGRNFYDLDFLVGDVLLLILCRLFS